MEHDAEAKAKQPRQGDREPPESKAGYTRRVDHNIPEAKITKRNRRQEQASSHHLLRGRFLRENEEEREKLDKTNLRFLETELVCAKSLK
ncbi:hypothetical protein Bca4012_078829 [Brassica carinata]